MKTKLTARECEIVRNVHRILHTDFPDSFAVEDGYAFCWLIAQRASNCDSRFLYHEGYLLKLNEKMPHAWNSLNGKIVDFAAPCSIDRQPMMFKYYEVLHTFTTMEVFDAMLERGEWNWMSKFPEHQEKT